MTDAQVEAGNRAAEAWQGLRTRIGSICDLIGSTFIPMLNRGYDATARFIVKVQSAVSKYEPVIEGYLTFRGQFLQRLASKIRAERSARGCKRRPTRSRGSIGRERPTRWVARSISNFEDLKAKVANADLAGYFSNLWTSILSINTSGSATVGSSLRDNLAEFEKRPDEFPQ